MTTKSKTALPQISLLALTTGIALGASPASAQFNDGSFQANGVVVEGQAQILRVPDVTEVTVESPSVVIDWLPDDDGFGGDLDFQLFGTTAIFQDDGIIADFAVLNRILPNDLTRRVVFNGTVVSQIQGQVGGTVFFYSPGGILVGSNAVFDVGNLGLTTAEPVTDGFGNFILGDTVTFAQSAPTSDITIDSGAQIFADLNQGSYVALFAPRIINRGLIAVDGQAALVAGEAGTITFSPDGLFDIQVDIGSDFFQPIENTGFIGGPASADGSSRVYMVAISKNSAATIAISGGSSLGFDVANSAFMDGDTVVLSAGFNVTAGEIEANEASDGFINISPEDSGFGPGIAFTSSVVGKAASDVNLNIRDALDFQGNATFSGRQVLANLSQNFGTGSVGDLFVGGDLDLLADHSRPGADVGIAQLVVFDGTNANITGNLQVVSNGTVDGDGNGFVSASVSEIVVNGLGSVLNVGGELVSGSTVDLTGIADGLIAQSSTARLTVENNGIVNVGGVTRIESAAIGGLGGEGQSGEASLFLSSGGQMTTDELNITSRAVGGDGDGMGVQAGTAFSSLARINANGMGTTLTVLSGNSTGDAAQGELDFLLSEAIGGTGIDGDGGSASAGNIDLFVELGAVISLPDDPGNPLNIVNRAIGGDTSEDDGRGGDANVGFSQILVSEGIQNLGRISYLAEAIGGSALPTAERTNGGNTSGGSLVADFFSTIATIAFDQIQLTSLGGNASSVGSSFAGAGSAGNVNINIIDSQLDILSGLEITQQGIGGTSSAIGGFAFAGQTAISSFDSNVNIAGDLTVSLDGRGGDSLGDQLFDPFFAFDEQGGGASTSSINLSVNSSEFAVTGAIDLSNTATGGNALVNRGGDGNTGGINIDMSLDPFVPGRAVNLLTASDISLRTEAIGGSILTIANPDSFGSGGDGFAGNATVRFNGGDNLIDSSVSATTDALGGDAGALDGQGGQSSTSSASVEAFASGNSTISGNLTLFSQSIGGDALSGFGGDSFGNGNVIQTFGGEVTVSGNASLTSHSEGGDGINGGSAFGMTQAITGSGSTVRILAATSFTMDAIGGDASFGTGGQGIGGFSQLTAQNSGLVDLAGDVIVNSNAQGGSSVDGLGGTAFAGSNQVSAFDQGVLSLGTNLSINSAATGGNSANGTGGQGSASGNQIFADNADITIDGDLGIAAQVSGGDGVSGGIASGSSITIDTFGGQIQVAGETNLSSISTGGDATSGIGGQAGGGSVQVAAFNMGAVDLMSEVFLSSVARAGDSMSGVGGTAFGSGANVTANSGAITIGGNATLIGDTEGGTGTDGGNVSGANVGLNAFDTQTFDIAGDVSLMVNTRGGDATTGLGGRAEFGGLDLSFNESTVNLTGSLTALGIARGGDGATGGFASTPFTSPFLFNSAVSVGSNFVLDTQALGGMSSGAFQQGGDAFAEFIGMDIDNTTLSVGGILLLNSSTVGGDALDGDGGNGTTSRRDLNISGGSTLDANALRFQGFSAGGNALGTGAHSGGNALTDHARLNYSFDSATNIAAVNADVTFSTNASGGDTAASGGNAGTANAGNGEIYNFVGGSTLDIGGDINFDFVANGGNAPQGLGGSATLGTAQVIALSGGSVLVAGGINVFSLGRGGEGQTGGDANAGVQQFFADGTIALDGDFTVFEQVFGGNALASVMPGTGGNAQGGAVSITASNEASIPFSLVSIGSISVDSTATGGNGGDGLNGADGGAGGNAFGDGGVILGQAINGVLEVNGATTLTTNIIGGRGGDGVNGGDGGQARFGGMQIGTSSGGSVPGAVGGSSTFTTIDITRNNVGGDGGTASNGTGGDGGEAVGGSATLLSRGAPVNVGAVNFTIDAAGGNGGAGTTQGDGGDGVAGNGSLLATEAFENPGRGSSNIGSFTLNSSGVGGAGSTSGASEFSAFSDIEIEQSDVVIGSITVNIVGDNAPDFLVDDGSGAMVPTAFEPFFVSLRDGATLDFGSINITTNGDVELFAGDASSAVGNVFQIVAGNFVPTQNDISGPGYVPGVIDAAGSLELTATSGDIIAEALLVSANDLILNSFGSITTLDLTGSSIFLTLGAGGNLDTGAVNAPGGLIAVEAVDSLFVPDTVNAASLLLRSLGGSVNADLPINLTGDFIAEAGVSVDLAGVSAQNVVLSAGGGDIVSSGAINAIGVVDLNAGAAIALTDVFADSILAFSQNSSFVAGNLVAGGFVGVEAAGTINILNIEASSIDLRSLNSFINLGTLEAEEGAEIEAEDDVNLQMATARSMNLRSLLGNVDAAGALDVAGGLNVEAGGEVNLGEVSADVIEVAAGTGLMVGAQWSAGQISLAAPNLVLAGQAQLDTGSDGAVSIISTNEFGLFLGDNADAGFEGLILGTELFERISANNLAISAIGAGGSGGDASIGDLDLSAVPSIGNFTFGAAQDLDVVGSLLAQSDVTLQSDEVTVDLDAGGRINLGTDGTTLTINSQGFIVGDTGLLSFDGDPTPEEAQTLANTPTATPIEEGVISAGTLVLNVGEVAVIQNTGTAETPAGFVVGSAEGLVLGDDQRNGDALILLNGQIVDTNGNAATGDDAATAFFEALGDNIAVGEGSQLNSCGFSSCLAEEVPDNPVDDDTGEITSTVSASVNGATSATNSATSSTSSTTSTPAASTSDSGGSSSSGDAGGETSSSEGSSESSEGEGSDEGESAAAAPSVTASGAGSAGGGEITVDNVDDGGGGANEFVIEDSDSGSMAGSDAGSDSGADDGSGSGEADSGSDDSGSDEGGSEDSDSGSEEGESSEEGEASDEGEGESESEDSEDSEESEEEDSEEDSSEEEEDSQGPATGPINPPPSIINTNDLDQRGTINDPISGSGNPALLDPEVTLESIDTDGGL